jgi:hypothetical protein
MKDDPKDLVSVADGHLVRMEMYQKGLSAAGIQSRIVGQQLEAGLGTAIPESIELWVHRLDAERAATAIARMEQERTQKPREHSTYGHPKSDRMPPQPTTHGTHTHYDADPRGG